MNSVMSTIRVTPTSNPGLIERILAPRTGKLLILIMALVATITPLTESLYTWDHFLQTGHDFEFSLFSFLTTVALVVLLARLMKQFPQQLSSGLLRLQLSALGHSAMVAVSSEEHAHFRLAPTPLRI
jgi:cytochrome c biogenesis factor